MYNKKGAMIASDFVFHSSSEQSCPFDVESACSNILIRNIPLFCMYVLEAKLLQSRLQLCLKRPIQKFDVI